MSLVSSLFFLSAIAFIYGATGTANIAQLGAPRRAAPNVQLILHLLLLIAFGIKAAIFPLSFWLPDSCPTAPAPVTAVFAGLLTKVGVYAIIRTETVIFAENDVTVLLMVVGGLTMLIGILGALTQADIKRLLSFTLVSHIGYMIFGIAVGSELGYAATIYYVVHHITVQTTLFTTGLIERFGGATSINRLAGLLKASPLLAILFFIPALNLGGIPPFSGFPRQGRASSSPAPKRPAGGCRGHGVARLGRDRGGCDHLAHHAVRADALLEHGVLARPRELEGYESVLLGSVQEAPEGATVTATRTTPVMMVAATTALVA